MLPNGNVVRPYGWHNPPSAGFLRAFQRCGSGKRGQLQCGNPAWRVLYAGFTMPRFEKWLHAATSNAPSDEIARSALAERLLAVAHYLKKSVGGKDEAEAVHQLRVWTRRAGAALDLFEPGVPKKTGERMEKTLHKLRKAAGDVRDCDVQKDRVKAMDEKLPMARRSLKKCRRKAERQLKRLRRELRKGDRFNLAIEQLLSRITWPKRHSSREAPPFATLCRRQLAPLATGFFRSARLDLSEFKNLHQMRIAGKGLRYALELAVAVIPERIHRQLYEALNELQDRAGEVCDQRAFLDSVKEWLGDAKKRKSQERLKALQRRERQRYEAAHRKFLKWWSEPRRRKFVSLWKKAF
jgi:CHAD domain-containing protein